jgi:carboxyl-terminal processing protease
MKHYIILILVLLIAACTPTVADIPVTGINDDNKANSKTPNGVPECDFIPGVSVPVSISPEAAAFPSAPAIPPVEPDNVAVDAAITARQIELYQEVMKTVQENHVFPIVDGELWTKYHRKNEALIKGGLSDERFYQFLQQEIAGLGDGESKFFNPAAWALSKNASAATTDFVGIGASFFSLEGPNPALIITGVFPGSPAEEGGLKSHDAIIQVDGGAVFDDQGRPATMGPEASTETLTVQTPGQPPREVQLRRNRVQSSLPLPFCQVQGTNIGYIHLLGLNNPNTLQMFVEELDQMSQNGFLLGLIIDTRVTNGNELDALKNLLGLFTQGTLGSFVSRTGEEPFVVSFVVDVQGSQTVPLVVLQDQTSGALAQLVAGLLQQQERAVVIGEYVNGPFYTTQVFEFRDGSALILSTSVYRPYEKTDQRAHDSGVMPDVVLPSRWDLFTDENDPLIAKAVELLMQKEGDLYTIPVVLESRDDPPA